MILRKTILLGAFVVLIFWPAQNLLTAGEKGQESIDPKADQVIQKALKYIGGLTSLRAEYEMILKVEAEGMNQEMTSSYSIALQRPDKLAMVMKKGMGTFGGTLVCDGTNVHSYVPMAKKYSKKEAPETLEELDISPGSGESFNALIFEYLIRQDAYERVMAKVKDADYIDLEEIEGLKFHHLRLSTEEADLDVWIEDGDKPFVSRVVPDMAKAMEKEGEQAMEMMKGMKIEMEIVFRDWDIITPHPEDTFVFTPPEDAEPAKPSGPHPLLDKPAPLFKLELLDEGEFDLAQQKDNNIVILDFWATWCGPCKKAMPIIIEVAEEYKDRGVVLITVNLREGAEKIHPFLLEQGIYPAVALDKDGTVGKLYEATAIPQTVIIGKDGTVEVVHVGMSSDLREKLKKELDDLLAGKKLTTAI